MQSQHSTAACPKTAPDCHTECGGGGVQMQGPPGLNGNDGEPGATGPAGPPVSVLYSYNVSSKVIILAEVILASLV